MAYSHVLWDFNGTLLDDVGIGMEAINALLAPRGLPTLKTRAEYHRHFQFPIEEYYRSVGFDFTKDPYDLLAREWIVQYRAREATAPLFPGATEALTYIKQQKIPQILFSATQKEMLLQQISALGIDGWFDGVLGSDDIYARGKIHLGKAWVEAVRPPRALLVGDTVHDARAAECMGIECVLVATGHQSRETLQSCGVPVLTDLFALPDFLRKTQASPLEKGKERDV